MTDRPIAEVLNRALSLHQAGQPAGAIPLYQQYLQREPGGYAARYNLAIALEQSGQPAAAIDAYRKVLAEQPGYADAHHNLGALLLQAGMLKEALAHSRAALRATPHHADAAFNAANILLHGGELEEAIMLYRTAIAARPDFARAHYNLGLALCRADRIVEGFAAWHQSAHVMANGRQPAHAGHECARLAYVNNALDNHAGERVDGAALREDSFADAAARRQTQAGLVVIDNALTPSALERLRQFCWGADVWRTAHKDGYLIATPQDGFTCPLLAQIAQELRATLVDILGGHPLHYLAGFQQLDTSRGADIHADNAAVNVNLWITPDEANHDPERGGLVVWSNPSPQRDSYVDGRDAAAVRAHLKDSGAQPITIPYRANRMIVFDSSLFHETDQIDFRRGHTDRRINITFLFGTRARP